MKVKLKSKRVLKRAMQRNADIWYYFHGCTYEALTNILSYGLNNVIEFNPCDKIYVIDPSHDNFKWYIPKHLIGKVVRN